MNSSVNDAFSRAAKCSPLYGLFDVFVQATDPASGRPVADRVGWVEQVHGRLRFLDVDDLNRSLGGEVGDAVATLLTDWPTTPDALRDARGDWYAVKSGLGRDSLGVATKLSIRRWKGDPPAIE